MALRWKAYAPNTVLKAVEVQDLADNGVVQVDTAADLADANLINANAAYVTGEHKAYQRIAAGVGADKWGAFGGGKILQIVRATDATQRTTTSTSLVDANISVTITPKKSDSEILVIWSYFGRAADNQYLNASITDSSDNALSGAESIDFGTTGATLLNVHVTAIGRSTPATTSPVTYKGRFKSPFGGTATLFNDLNTGQLYAIEVAA